MALNLDNSELMWIIPIISAAVTGLMCATGWGQPRSPAHGLGKWISLRGLCIAWFLLAVYLVLSDISSKTVAVVTTLLSLAAIVITLIVSRTVTILRPGGHEPKNRASH
jgi:drug/metabolite transporter (DMT)-like permease